MKKIGIFSGTFDPIHNGHIALAKQALNECQLYKIFFLVEPRPRRKQGVRAFEHRVSMVQLALEHEPRFATIRLEHAQFNAEQTLPLLQERFKGSQLFMLMGDDMLFSHFVSWPHLESLIKSVRFIIGTRTAISSDIKKHIQQIAQTKGLEFHYEIIKTPHTTVSSKSVRECLRKGRECSDIHPAVESYIKQHRLYHPRGLASA